MKTATPNSNQPYQATLRLVTNYKMSGNTPKTMSKGLMGMKVCKATVPSDESAKTQVVHAACCRKVFTFDA